MNTQRDSGYDEWILRALRRISRAVDLHSRQLASRHGLTAPQLVCLRQLAQTEGIGPGRLAKEVSLSPATITGIVDRLENRGLVTRQRSKWDRRQVELYLTDEGRELVESAPLPLHERFSRRLARLPEHRQAEIEKTLSLIVEMMEAENLDAAPLLSSGPATADSEELEEFLAPDASGSEADSRAPEDVVDIRDARGPGGDDSA